MISFVIYCFTSNATVQLFRISRLVLIEFYEFNFLSCSQFTKMYDTSHDFRTKNKRIYMYVCGW